MVFLGVPNSVKALVLCVILFCLACLYGSASFYRDPGSIFFDSARAYERSYSLYRQIESARFRNITESALQKITSDANHSSSHYKLLKSSGDPQICAAFITVARNISQQYIDVAISSALAGLAHAEREDLNVQVYFANTNPVIHPAWHSWFSHVVDAIYSPGDAVSVQELQQLLKLEKEEKWQQKSGIDYAIALQMCLDNSAAPFVAIFEEDVVFADGWVTRTLLGLQDVEKQLEAMGSNSHWLFMRLFNEERASGWASHDILGNRVPLISLCVAIMLCVLLQTIRHRWHRLFKYLDNRTIFVICWVAGPAFVLLFFQSGKASMLPPKPGVRLQNFGCCTQGMIYPREQLPGAIASLKRQARTTPYDISLNNFAREEGLERFALYPIQLQHLGFRSVINPNRKTDALVWSMAFESLQASLLQKEHQKMVCKLYGSGAWQYRSQVSGT